MVVKSMLFVNFLKKILIILFKKFWSSFSKIFWSSFSRCLCTDNSISSDLETAGNFYYPLKYFIDASTTVIILHQLRCSTEGNVPTVYLKEIKSYLLFLFFARIILPTGLPTPLNDVPQGRHFFIKPFVIEWRKYAIKHSYWYSQWYLWSFLLSWW